MGEKGSDATPFWAITFAPLSPWPACKLHTFSRSWGMVFSYSACHFICTDAFRLLLLAASSCFFCRRFSRCPCDTHGPGVGVDLQRSWEEMRVVGVTGASHWASPLPMAPCWVVGSRDFRGHLRLGALVRRARHTNVLQPGSGSRSARLAAAAWPSLWCANPFPRSAPLRLSDVRSRPRQSRCGTL